MLNVGGPELLIILLVALVFLGPERLPDIARQTGQAVSSLRSLASGFQAEMEAASKPAVDRSMTLEGPTDQAAAIAATQTDPFAGRFKEPFSLVKTDPDELKHEARRKQMERREKPVSPGGPVDLTEQPTDDLADQLADETDEEE